MQLAPARRSPCVGLAADFTASLGRQSFRRVHTHTSSPPGIAVRRTASLRSPMTRWSMLKGRDRESERLLSMDCRIKSGNDDMKSHARGACAPESCKQTARSFASKRKGRRSADRRIHPCPRHTHRRYRLKVRGRGSDPSGDRSPLGAPTAALATQINAMAQPRPRFARNTMRRRYLRCNSRLQRCTSRAGHVAGRLMPKPPGSGVTNPARRNRTRSIDGCRRRRPFDERASQCFGILNSDICQGRYDASFSSLPGSTRQSMRHHRVLGASTWTTGSSPVVTRFNAAWSAAQPATEQVAADFFRRGCRRATVSMRPSDMATFPFRCTMTVVRG
jgi:hypothetical protein